MRSPDIAIGGRYIVDMADCCVAGRFESDVTAMRRTVSSQFPEDTGYLESVEFSNGVVLTECDGVTFTAIGGES